MTWFQEKHSNKIKWVNYAWLVIIFGLNFLASPVLKYIYLGYLCFVLFSVLFFDFKTSAQVFIGFSFIEGQGRILWEYGALFRIIFDVMLIIVVLRSFIKSKGNSKISSNIPHVMLVLITLHFLWYILEIFNTDVINVMGPIAAMKIYVVPFFVFLMFNMNDELFDEDNLNSIVHLILFLLIAESALSILQLVKLEKHMLAISNYYRHSMRDGVFTGLRFRPYGTGHLPGGVGVFIFLSSALLFVKRKISKKYLLLITIVLILNFTVLIFTQIRSAMLKFAFAVLGSYFSLVINSKKRTALLFRISIGLSIFIPIFLFLFGSTISKNLQQIENLESSLQRWEGMDNIEHVGSQRLGPILAFGVAVERLTTFPFGIGPGMTGAVSSISADQIKSDPFFKSDVFWGYDNFFLTMIVEYGYGAIFYISYLLSIPILLIKRTKELFFKGDYINSRILMICAINIVVIIGGNWGANGLPFNPESFYFLLWAAIGFNVYKKAT